MELTGNVQGLIDLVGGGSDVEFEQILESGEKIGVITIDNVPTDIYAPEGAEVEVTQVLSSGTKIASIEVDGESVDLYAPTPEEPTSVEVTQVVSSGTKIATIEVDGVDTDLYAPESGSSVPDYSTTPVNTGRKWIDGKDEFEVTMSITLSSSNVNYIDISNLNIDTMISADFLLIRTNGSAIFAPYYEDSTWQALPSYDALNNRIGFISSTTVINSGYNTLNIILRYTQSA